MLMSLIHVALAANRLIDWQQIPAMMVDATKCGDTPNPRRTEAELSPPGQSNVPNLRDGGDYTADDNSPDNSDVPAARPS